MIGARGEAVITDAEGNEVATALYTNYALSMAEKSAGKSIIGIAEGFSTGESGITEIAHVLQAGMEMHRREAKAGGRVISLGDAFDVLDKAGFSVVAAAVMEAVAAVLSYGSETEDVGPNA